MFDLPLRLILTTFGLVFVAELPDKTALASLVLATRYRAEHVVAGAWLAFLLQTALAVTAGGFLHLLPARPVHIASGAGFLLFALLALRRDEAEELGEEAEAVARHRRWHSAVVTSFVTVFAAELGDLTQLATAALVARSGHPLAVAVGAVPALWAVTLIAVAAGSQAGRFFDADLLNRVSAALFALVGLVIIVTALLA